MNITLRFDSLAAIMSVLVLGIGALVLFYCADYFHHHDGHTEKRLPSFAAELVAFSGAMFGLVVSDNMLLLYVFWELTTVLSFLLVGHYAERATSRRAATQALLVTTFGGLAMLVGIIVLGNMAGTYLLSELIASPPTGHGGLRRRRARPRRGTVQIGDRADALLAARRDGRPDTGQRVSARRGDGQGRRLSVGADDARLRGFPTVAPHRHHARHPHHAAGRLAGGARVRPQVDPRVRHGQPTRADHRHGRLGWQRHDARRAGHAVRARDVQGVAVHGRRRHRPRHRHPRHPQAGLARSAQQAAAASSPSAPPPAWRRCRRSSASSPRRPTSKPCCTARRWARPRRSCSRASCWVRCSPPSTACASCRRVRPQRTAGAQHPGCRNAPPRNRFPVPARVAGCGRAAVRAVADRSSTTCWTATRTRCPAGQDYDLALWHGLGLPLLLSVLVLAVGTAAFFGRVAPAPRAHRARTPRQRRQDLRRRGPRHWTYCRSGSPRSPSAVRFPRRSR